MYPLGELLDMYHDYQASKRHDKIFALLGMCSDDAEQAGLSPDYQISWRELLARAVRLMLGDEAEICTWHDRELALIRSRMRVLGQVISVQSRTEDRQTFCFKDTSHEEHTKFLSVGAKEIVEGDIICHLQGAPTASIVRAHGDYLTVIMIGAPIKDTFVKRTSPKFETKVVVLWNWESTAEEEKEADHLEEELINAGVERELEDIHTVHCRSLDIAWMLYHLRRYEGALERYHKVREAQKTRAVPDALTLEIMERLLVCYVKTNRKEKAAVTLLEAEKMSGQTRADGSDDFWSLLCTSERYPRIRHSQSWYRLLRIVEVMELERREFTENVILKLALAPDDQVAPLLYSNYAKRHDIFGLSESVLLLLAVRALWYADGRKQRIPKFLLSHYHEDAQTVQWIFKLARALQTDPVAIGWILLKPHVHKGGIYGFLQKWIEKFGKTILDLLRQMEDDRSQAKLECAKTDVSPEEAVDYLDDLLYFKDVELTDGMLELAATSGNKAMVEALSEIK